MAKYKKSKKHPVGVFFYYWRMVRDSNPRKGCPFNGFQDRRIRPLCQPSETLFPPVSQPTVLVFRMTQSCLHSTSLTLVVKTRTPRHTLPTIRNFISAGLSTYGFGLCSISGIYSTLFFADCKHKNSQSCKKHQ